MTTALLVQLERWEVRLMRRMQQAPRVTGESAQEYIHCVNVLAKEQIAASELPSLPQLALKRYHSWAGHCGRLPNDR